MDILFCRCRSSGLLTLAVRRNGRRPRIARFRSTRTTDTTFCFDSGRPFCSPLASTTGAVLNLDFDYVKYLDTLAADGLNLTRTFSGAYVELRDTFGIAGNTLAPEAGRFI